MATPDSHIDYLLTAEFQFRLASAVRLATTLKRQPLDLPLEWTHGLHSVRCEEIALRDDQAEFAACFLQRSATFMMAVAAKEAIEAVVPRLREAPKQRDIFRAVSCAIRATDPKCWAAPDEDVETSYHILRLIRNAFAHEPFKPTWRINQALQARTFSVDGVITFDTDGLDKNRFVGKTMVDHSLCSVFVSMYGSTF